MSSTGSEFKTMVVHILGDSHRSMSLFDQSAKPMPNMVCGVFSNKPYAAISNLTPVVNPPNTFAASRNLSNPVPYPSGC